LAASFSGVLAPRMAGFGDRFREKSYIIKSTLALLPITAGIIVWIIFAKPFILFLFGAKYLQSVPVFQALAAAQIPFLFTVPSVTAIIYSMKKTVFIGAFSFFQIAAIFLLNFIFIPKYGPIGPTITFGITNTILAIYTWVIVIKHYWLASEK
jgi:O-antigen/teichoic acid export membrane protein